MCALSQRRCDHYLSLSDLRGSCAHVRRRDGSSAQPVQATRRAGTPGSQMSLDGYSSYPVDANGDLGLNFSEPRRGCRDVGRVTPALLSCTRLYVLRITFRSRDGLCGFQAATLGEQRQGTEGGGEFVQRRRFLGCTFLGLGVSDGEEPSVGLRKLETYLREARAVS